MQPDTRTISIKKGLLYLQLQLETKEYPFSSDSFGKDRSHLQFSATVPDFSFGDLHESFNLYVLVLFLEKHLPVSFRKQVIEKIRPKEIGPLNFFGDINGSCDRFPDDPETTAVCYHGLLKTNAVTERELATLAQSIFENVNDDGVIQTYFVTKDKPRYNRLDAVTIINILRFAYALRQESSVKLSEDYVFNWLKSGDYKSGTLYYPSSYTFLYFCSLLASTNYQTKARFTDTLRCEFNKIDQEDLKYPLDYALNILTGEQLKEVRNESLIEKLLDLQTEDGSWPADAFYATNRTKVYFGSKSLSTIFAVLALMETY